jgi:hypothetical protein
MGDDRTPQSKPPAFNRSLSSPNPITSKPTNSSSNSAKTSVVDVVKKDSISHDQTADETLEAGDSAEDILSSSRAAAEADNPSESCVVS